MIHTRPIFNILGMMLNALAVAMLLPAMVDGWSGDPDAHAFVGSALATGFVGYALYMSTRDDKPFEFDLRQGFLLTTLGWIVMPAFAALPLIGVGLDYTDAYFEAMSGITTTGSTVMVGLDTMPKGILLWRALIQWVGGVGIIVMAMVLLPFLRIGGMQLFRTESSETEKVASSAFRHVAWTMAVYSALTLACTLLYWSFGMTPFDAVCHAMSTLATGGYSTHDASFGFWNNPALEWTAIIFMLAGAVPFAIYIKFLQGKHSAPFHDLQIRALLLLLLVTSLVVAAWHAASAGIPFGTALRQAAFNLGSIVSTTGFASTDYSAWGAPVAGLVLMLTVVGGCTGSTSGGIKIYRFLVLGVIVRTQLLKLTRPRRVVIPTYDHHRLPDDVPASVLAFLVVFTGTVGAFTVALGAMGLDLVTALTASATAISNVGPGLGPIIGPAGNFASLPDAAKWLLAAAMVMGRLEVFAILLLFDPEFWRG